MSYINIRISNFDSNYASIFQLYSKKRDSDHI